MVEINRALQKELQKLPESDARQVAGLAVCFGATQKHMEIEIAQGVHDQEHASKKLLTVIRHLDDFTAAVGKNLAVKTFEEKRHILKFLVEEVHVDTVGHTIQVKHIIPTDSQKYPLHPWRLYSDK